MKIKRFLTLFSVIIISASFSACSNDDDDNNNNNNNNNGGNGSTPTVIKKLVSVRYESLRQGCNSTYRPSYDSQGRISEIVIKNNQTGAQNVVPFTWSGNSFVYKGNGTTENYTLQNGKIRQSNSSSGTTTYTYAANGTPRSAYYTTEDGDYTVTYDYSCTNTRFDRYVLKSMYVTRDYSYEYSSKQQGIGAHMVFLEFIDCGPKYYTFFHPEIFGMENMTELPDKMIMEESGIYVTYDIVYDIDKDGYVTSISMIPPIGSSFVDYTFYLQWDYDLDLI